MRSGMFVFTAIERIVYGQPAALALLLCGALAGAAWAQTYPTKPIRFIVGFVPGGGTDMMARTLSRRLSDSMGQQVIVDNRAGGGGLIAAVIAAKAPASREQGSRLRDANVREQGESAVG